MHREFIALLPATELIGLIVVGFLAAGSLLAALCRLLLDHWRQFTRDRQVCPAGRGRWMTAAS